MTLYSCILFWSMVNGIDPALTKAMISVESGGNPLALGRTDDSGLMQIRPKFTKFTQQQLFQSCTNIMVGTAILREMKYKCKHTIDKTFIVCYNLGKSRASKIAYPKSQSYYKKVIAKMEK